MSNQTETSYEKQVRILLDDLKDFNDDDLLCQMQCDFIRLGYVELVATDAYKELEGYERKNIFRQYTALNEILDYLRNFFNNQD